MEGKEKSNKRKKPFFTNSRASLFLSRIQFHKLPFPITRKKQNNKREKAEKESEKKCFYKRVGPEITQNIKREIF